MNVKPLPLLLLTLALAACTAGAPAATRTPPPTTGPTQPAPTPPPANPSTPPNTAQVNDVNGRDFVGRDVMQGTEERDLVPGTTIRLGFRAGQLSASAGCNLFGATYRIEDGRLIVDGGSMTEMGCDGPRHDQDDWLFGFLGADPALALDGDNLVLTSADGFTVITLQDREVAEPDQPLMGTTWTLTSIINGDTVSSIPAEVVATIVFGEDGQLQVSPGCNSGGGTYTRDGDTIQFGDIFLTKMACMGAGSQIENAVVNVLSAGTVTFSIDSGTLTLMAGENGLQFSSGG